MVDYMFHDLSEFVYVHFQEACMTQILIDHVNLITFECESRALTWSLALACA